MKSKDFGLLTIVFVIAYFFSIIYSGVIKVDFEESLRYAFLCISVGLAITTVVKGVLEQKQM